MFLESVFLWGLAAASVPVVIHMMQSPRARTIDFPCIRFLKACQKRATRRTRLKNIILMILRMLILALLSLGMAKPWREKEHTDVLPDAPVSMVIVLDNSYSMGYLDQGKSRFDRAREAANGLVGTLKPGDEVALLLCNEDVVHAVREFTTDRERIRAAMARAELSVLGTNLDPALREALRLANRAGTSAVKTEGADEEAVKKLLEADAEKEQRRRREIHVLTDLQAAGWDAVVKSNFLKTVDTKAAIYVTSFGRKGSANCFLESATVTAGGPEQCTVTAQVRAVGAGSPGNSVTLNVNGRNVAQETFAARPGAPASVPLVARLGAAGTYRCTLSLQDDALTLDDQYHFTVDVGESTKVLVVDGDPSAVGPISETFFLRNALNPGGLFAGEGSGAVDATIVGIGDLPAASLDDYRTVVLCNVPAVDGSDLVRLENFLRSGGSVWIFLGSKTNAQHTNAWSFLPISLRKPMGDATKEKSFGFGEQRGDHAIFKRKLDLRSARFFLCYGTGRATLKPRGAVLASFANGQPALIEAPFGKGRALLFTSTCDIEWSNFPLRRVFLPFVHQVLAYLSNQDVRTTAYRMGEVVKFQGPPSQYTARIVITDPEGRRVVLPQPQRRGGYAEVVFKNTTKPGMYQVNADPTFTNSGGFGVNLQVAESVVAMADSEKIRDAARSGLITFVDGPKRSIVEEIKKSREGQEFWPLLFKLALLVFIAESIFGNLISRAKRPGGARLPLFEVLRQRTPGVS